MKTCNFFEQLVNKNLKAIDSKQSHNEMSVAISLATLKNLFNREYMKAVRDMHNQYNNAMDDDEYVELNEYESQLMNEYENQDIVFHVYESTFRMHCLLYA